MPATRELVARQLGTGTMRGENGMAYPRFLTPVAERLAEGGQWTITKRFGSYCLALPDNGCLPRVKLQVPETDEILKLAGSLHKAGLPYEGWMWDWPLRYTPRALGQVVWPATVGRQHDARLDIGVPWAVAGGRGVDPSDGRRAGVVDRAAVLRPEELGAGAAVPVVSCTRTDGTSAKGWP